MERALTPERDRLQQLLRAKAQRGGSEIVALTLRDLGITHVYAVGGAPIDAAIGNCAKLGLRVIGARHQQGAVLMSLAHNYAAGCLCSAVIVASGPAVTNCATGMLVGHDNRWPLLVIGARRGLGRSGFFQELDGAHLLASLSASVDLVTDIASLPSQLAAAALAAAGAAPGPAYVDVAESVLGARDVYRTPGATLGGAVTPLRPAALAHPIEAASLRHAAAMLSHARRPVMLIGEGARWSAPEAELLRLADEFGVPFASSPMGRGLLPDDHPLCFSAVRGAMLAEADLVVTVGARLDWTFRFGAEVAQRARIVRLGTEPVEAADEPGRGVNVRGDIVNALQQLLQAMNPRGREADEAWLESLVARRASLHPFSAPSTEYGMQPMSPYEWLAELAVSMPADAVTVLDGNVVMTAAQRLLPVRRPASRLGPGTSGCMGVGVPFAIGAKLARPELPVVAVIGDFAFGLSAMELETAVRHRVPLVIVVANNAGAGGATRQRGSFAADHPERVLRFGCDIRHDLIMAAVGGRSRRVDAPGQIGGALQEALACNEPACIDVVTNENTPVCAAI